MSFTFDPYKAKLEKAKLDAKAKSIRSQVTQSEADDVLMTNPTAMAELESYWNRLPKLNGVPRRKDVNPSDLGSLLSNCFVVERVAPGVGRLRVAGQELSKLFGIDPRGVPLTALFKADSRIDIAAALENALETPAIVELPIQSPRSIGQPMLQGRILLLPLRDDHDEVTRLIGMLVMSGRRGVGGRRFVVCQEPPSRIQKLEGLRAVTSIPVPPVMTTAPAPAPSSARKPAHSTAQEMVDSLRTKIGAKKARTDKPQSSGPNVARSEVSKAPYLRLVVSND